MNAPVRLEHPTTRLKQLLAARRAPILPGTANALFARVIEDLGYEAVYITGAGIANMSLGVPDIGLVTLTELAEHVAQICDVVALPVLADADTGFGNPVNMTRTVQVLERAGAAGIQIEDQVFPKKCGHFKGKDVIPLAEMVQKVKAAVDSRRDGDFQIIARTDSRAVRGFAEAMERAHAFIAAGADVTFVEAPVSLEELTAIARDLPVPQLANMVFGGLTPAVPQAELAHMGFGGVIYANAALQAALQAVREVLGSLKQNGSLDAVRERLASFDERQRAVGKDRYDALEARYRD
ncbi:MAG TPA: isocitrate lyase/phosphoenolpyruvate mutase family protein [Xanthobacteraceae bacterium]|nr:isocitrate lyase/phosphoenolpyruvate mutase family protein [Xanthobacteraceae bacterium]